MFQLPQIHNQTNYYSLHLDPISIQLCDTQWIPECLQGKLIIIEYITDSNICFVPIIDLLHRTTRIIINQSFRFKHNISTQCVAFTCQTQQTFNNIWPVTAKHCGFDLCCKSSTFQSFSVSVLHVWFLCKTEQIVFFELQNA